jgi:hypothetical protein
MSEQISDQATGGQQEINNKEQLPQPNSSEPLISQKKPPPEAPHDRSVTTLENLIGNFREQRIGSSVEELTKKEEVYANQMRGHIEYLTGAVDSVRSLVFSERGEDLNEDSNLITLMNLLGRIKETLYDINKSLHIYEFEKTAYLRGRFGLFEDKILNEENINQWLAEIKDAINLPPSQRRERLRDLRDRFLGPLEEVNHRAKDRRSETRLLNANLEEYFSRLRYNFGDAFEVVNQILRKDSNLGYKLLSRIEELFSNVGSIMSKKEPKEFEITWEQLDAALYSLGDNVADVFELLYKE